MEYKKLMIILGVICALGITSTLYTAILAGKFNWPPFVLALSSAYFLWYTNDTRKRVNERKENSQNSYEK
ncbi:hypothetical protein MHH70_10815 [Metasolibacillus sp. FSL H7-0170]|uniref:hypothetical protein n=1 Tax=Metasolibacillus sp. FSL H7-0170 TaxID=2921431 RepID=UPI0031589F42